VKHVKYNTWQAVVRDCPNSMYILLNGRTEVEVRKHLADMKLNGRYCHVCTEESSNPDQFVKHFDIVLGKKIK